MGARDVISVNIFDMLWLLLFSVGGAIVGSQFAGTTGAGVGLLGGLALLFGLGKLQSREQRRLPPCQCGAEWETLILERHSAWGFVHRCGSCGHTLMLRRGSIIYMVEENTRIPYMRRTFMGSWLPAVRFRGHD